MFDIRYSFFSFKNFTFSELQSRLIVFWGARTEYSLLIKLIKLQNLLGVLRKTENFFNCVSVTINHCDALSLKNGKLYAKG